MNQSDGVYWPSEAGLAASPEGAFWRAHAWWPLLVFVLCFWALEVIGFDRMLARTWFFDADTAQWLGRGPGEWWARGILHTGGRWLVRGIAAMALALWVLSLIAARLRAWRRPAGF